MERPRRVAAPCSRLVLHAPSFSHLLYPSLPLSRSFSIVRSPSLTSPFLTPSHGFYRVLSPVAFFVYNIFDPYFGNRPLQPAVQRRIIGSILAASSADGHLLAASAAEDPESANDKAQPGGRRGGGSNGHAGRGAAGTGAMPPAQTRGVTWVSVSMAKELMPQPRSPMMRAHLHVYGVRALMDWTARSPTL